MKVLYFHQHFTTPAGSGGTRSYEMASALVARGHEVTIVCGSRTNANTGVSGPYRNGVREGDVDGITVVELHLPYSNYLGFIKRTYIFIIFALRSILIAMKRKYDLVFASSTPLTAGIPGIVASIFRRKPFVFEVRDLWPELPREMGVIKNSLVLTVMGLLEYASYHSAIACIGLAPGIVKGICRCNISEENVALIPNGCDTDLFKPVANCKRTLNGITDKDFVAVFTGAHGRANGLDAVINTAKVLLKRGVTNIKILFIGDGKEKPGLIKRSSEEGLSTICIFLPYMPKSELSLTMNMVDAGLQVLANVPVFYNGTSPNKFFDYLSAGLPVINNYPGWLASIIDKYECGIAVPPDNPEAFADALVFLSSNTEVKEKMGQNARQLALTEFSRKRLGEQFVSFLEKYGPGR